MKLTRKLNRISRVLPPIRFASIKGNTSVHCDSHLEMFFYHQLEFNNLVQAYKPQPFSFSYELDGKTRRYTPDVLVKYFDESFESFEVKPQSKVSSLEFKKKHARLEEVFNEDIGHPLRLVTCKTIRKGHTVANLRNLYRYKFEKISHHILELVSSILIPNQQYKLSELYVIFQIIKFTSFINKVSYCS